MGGAADDLTFAEADRGRAAEIVDVLWQAFRGDEILLSQLGLDAGRLRRFWPLQVGLFLRQGSGSGRPVALGAFDGERLVGAALGYEEGWWPGSLALLGHFGGYGFRLGARALRRYVRYCREFAKLAAPAGRVLRLASLGCADGRRGQGIGGRLLEELAELGRRRGHSRIQLEVEEANRARRLYERAGYRLDRSFTLCGEPMQVMVREL